MSEQPTLHEETGPMAQDIAKKRAWILLGVLVATFLIGLVAVSFWGGPYEADSFWLKEASPTFPN